MPTFHTPEPISVTVEIGVGEIQSVGNPNVRSSLDAGVRREKQLETWPQHADHLGARTSQVNALPDDFWIGSVAALPDALA